MVARTMNSVYIPPYDNPKIIVGHSSIVGEIKNQLLVEGVVKCDSIICSVGGGGLVAGIVRGLRETSWPEGKFSFRSPLHNTITNSMHNAMSDFLSLPVTVIACETCGSASLQASLRESWSYDPPQLSLPSLRSINTIATSLGSKVVSRDALHLVMEHDKLGGVVSVVVEDERTVSAIREFASESTQIACDSCSPRFTLLIRFVRRPRNHSRASVLSISYTSIHPRHSSRLFAPSRFSHPVSPFTAPGWLPFIRVSTPAGT
jgi:L-serine/L-threonine ammonia-lyase